KHSRQIRKNIGMVFQQFNLFPNMKVLRNITEAPVHVLGLDKDAAEERARELCRLPPKSSHWQFSLSCSQAAASSKSEADSRGRRITSGRRIMSRTPGSTGACGSAAACPREACARAARADALRLPRAPDRPRAAAGPRDAI